MEILNFIQIERKKALKKEKTYQLKGIVTDVNSNNCEIVLHDEKASIFFPIIVPKKLFIEVVKKYWLNKVKIKAFKTYQGTYLLDRISAA